jgi:starch synthase
MGNDTSTILSAYNLPPSDNPKLPVWARHLPLPMGLASADRIVAVSKGYAQEILTPEHGSGLDGFLKSRKGAISGILNGLNTEVWDPRKDPLITCNFDQSDIDPRQENKASLLKELGLDENPDLPLLAFIGRMDPQKGIDIILDALRSMTIMPWQAILLGTGIPSLEEACRRFQNELPHRVRSVIRFDAALSHWLFSGADVLMVPSRYEPCGIVQMIAMRYGCLPLAHNTGGLRDTIQDIGAAENGNGFLFEPATATALAAAIQRVLILYGQPQRWKQVQMNAMAEDYSWHQSAAAYAKLYTDLYKEGKQ